MELSFLNKLGLSHKEIKIYETLLKHGEMFPGSIIKTIGLKRATVYKLLYSLEEKGFIIQRKIQNKASFSPEPPSKLMEILKMKVEEEQKVLKSMQDQLPELINSYVFSLEKPTMTFFTGIEGLKKVYQETLDEGKFIRSSVKYEQVDPGFFNWIVNYYVPEKQKRQIPAHMMVSDAEWVEYYSNLNMDGLSELIVISKDLGTKQHSVAIYGDKVAFVNYLSDNSILVVVIHHALIARTLESWFDLAWKGAEAMGLRKYK